MLNGLSDKALIYVYFYRNDDLLLVLEKLCTLHEKNYCAYWTSGWWKVCFYLPKSHFDTFYGKRFKEAKYEKHNSLKNRCILKNIHYIL